jgi:hypothetical protein
VVCDANVYIHAAVERRRTGQWPVDWSSPPRTLEEASLHALSAIAGGLPDIGAMVSIVLYSSADLDDIVLRKLSQPADPSLSEAEQGLGWAEADADDTYGVLCRAIDTTGRSFLIEPPPGATALPGADYEDRCVWGLFRAAMDDVPDAEPILVTNDRALAAQVNAEALRHGSRMPWQAVSARRFCELLAAHL